MKPNLKERITDICGNMLYGQEESVGAMKNGREGQTYGQRQVKEMLPI